MSKSPFGEAIVQLGNQEPKRVIGTSMAERARADAREQFYALLDGATITDNHTAKLLRIKHVLEHYHNGDFATKSRDFGKGMAFLVDLIEKAERGDEIEA